MINSVERELDEIKNLVVVVDRTLNSLKAEVSNRLLLYKSLIHF